MENYTKAIIIFLILIIGAIILYFVDRYIKQNIVKNLIMIIICVFGSGIIIYVLTYNKRIIGSGIINSEYDLYGTNYVNVRYITEEDPLFKSVRIINYPEDPLETADMLLRDKGDNIHEDINNYPKYISKTPEGTLEKF